MAISIVGVGAQTAYSGTNITPAWPGSYSPTAGDLAVVVLYGRVSAQQTTSLSNYTLLGNSYRDVGAIDLQVRSWYRVLDGTESAPTITISGWTSGSAAFIVVISGVDGTTPVHVAAVASDSGAATTWAPTGLTTTVSGSMVLAVVTTSDDNNLAFNSGNDQGFNLDAGGTAYQFDLAQDGSAAFASKVVSPAGAVTAPTFEQTANASDSWAGFTVALLPTPFTATGSAVASGSATIAIGRNRTATGAALAVGTAITPWRRTASGAAALTATVRWPVSRQVAGQAVSNGTAAPTWQPTDAIAPMTIDDSEVLGPDTFATVAALEPATIDSGLIIGPNFPATYAPNPPVAPPVDPPILPVSPTFVPYVYATNEAGQIFTTGARISWTDQLSDTGVGTVEVDVNDPLAAGVQQYDRIRCWIYGVPAFTFIVENLSERRINAEEESGATLVLQGRGWLAELDYARIYPWGGADGPVTAQNRLWSFASPNFPNTAGWSAPFSQGQVKITNPLRFVNKEQRVLLGDALKSPNGTVIVDDIGEPDASDSTVVRASQKVTIITPFPAPLEWPVPDAHWIWGSTLEEPGYNYFRSTLTIPQDTRVTIAGSGDDLWTIFFDGIPILGEAENVWGWQSWKGTTFDVEAGTYTLAAVVWNRVRPGPLGPLNPGGLILAAYELGPSDTVRQVFNNTDGEFPPGGLPGRPTVPNTTRYAWTSIAYPSQEPGWFLGQMIGDMTTEAQARTNLTDWVLGFSATADTDGTMWSGTQGYGSYLPAFSAPIGSSILDALKRLTAQGWLDFHVTAAGNPTLLAWNYNEAGGVTSATFTQGVNITSLSVAPTPVRYDRLLVKWSGGTFTIGSDGLEGYLTLNVTDEGEALREAQTILDDMQSPDPTILMEIEPQVGPKPYLDYGVGDTVTITGLGEARIYAISVTIDDDGNPRVTLELNRQWPSAERTRQNLLQTLGSGTVGRVRSDVLATTDPV